MSLHGKDEKVLLSPAFSCKREALHDNVYPYFSVDYYKIAVVGTGYVGLSLATLLSQYRQVTAVDIVLKTIEMINNRKSSIRTTVLKINI